MKLLDERQLLNLKRVYAAALACIALAILASSFLMQYAISQESADSRIINLSGRQRMLSQRLTKCALALALPQPDAERIRLAGEIRDSLADWVAAQEGLQHGDSGLGLPGREHSARIRALFADIRPHFTAMVRAIGRLQEILAQGPADPGRIEAAARELLSSEPQYLALMDAITFQFDQETGERIAFLQDLEIAFLALGLTVLLLEFLLVFRPTTMQITALLSSLRRRSEALRGTNVRLRDSLRESRRLAELAKAADRAKSEFLARMSHEIRTPLNAVIGMCHLALRTALTPKQRDYLAKIRLSSNTLLGVINDILDFSKIEAGKLNIESTRLKLEEVLGSVVDINSLAAEEKRLEFLLHLGDGLPAEVLGDPLRLGQVLVNLVHNAIKFTEKGEVVLTAALEGKGQDRARIRFSVRDTGIGMSQEEVAGLFRPFTQADGSITRRFGGTGLGLSICSRLVALMGGRLEVVSSPGRGSEFFFGLEFPVVEETLQRTARDISELSGAAVLVVDDNATSRLILRDILRSLRFRVATAASGQEALRLIERSNRFRVVLLDWRMPGMDGAACARRIRSMPLPRQPAIIMVTAYGREEVRREAESAGAEALLLKPVSRSVLFNTIAEALGQPGCCDKPAQLPGECDAPDFPRLRGARVLLVEDNAINQQVARELLECAGLVVTVAGDGEEALNLLARETFQVVLMDIQMPGMGGLEAVRRIRAQLGLADLPVIAMTAHAMNTDREESLRAGMNDHVNKPVDPRELYAALDRWVPEGGWSPAAPANGPAAPELAEAAAPDGLPGVEAAMGLARVRGNRALFRKLLREFSREFADAARNIRASLDAGDIPGGRGTLHTLRGVAGNIGAMGIHGLAAELDACIGTDPGQCRILLARLEAELARVVAGIREALGPEGGVGQEAAPAGAAGAEGAEAAAGPDRLGPDLAALHDLLGQHDTQALDVFATLAPELRRRDPQGVEALDRALQRFDFRAARTHAAAMLETLRGTGGE